MRRPSRLWTGGPARALAVVLAGVLGLGLELSAQDPGDLLVEGPDGSLLRIPVTAPRGYAAVAASELERLGWTFLQDGDMSRAHSAADHDLLFREGSPWVRWGDRVFHLADVPFAVSERLHLPAQVALDLLPRILPAIYRYSSDGFRLQVLDADFWRPAVTDGLAGQSVLSLPATRGPPPVGPSFRKGDPPEDVGDAEEAVARVVVIDPGHGGSDPGAVGRRGVREKDVALDVGRALARQLRRDADFEVYMTREDDTLVPLWKRGELATGWKGDRPGIFVSLHANALPRSRSIRGYETYFLSEARTEHERRVAAIENAALELDGQGAEAHQNPDLDFILKELRNLDHQHWSALLAEMVQEEMRPVHPGPDRGVKQGPFAVITNALMPSILVEVGFLTNPQEELLLGQSGFQDDAAQALAEAIRRFFQRYPPGQGSSAQAGR